MGLNSTPSANRVHIGFFGRRNAGKSSVVNAVTGQELAVVSDTKGTTTDPVYKSMELLPIGPVMIIDTPGFDDEGALGALRVRKTKQVLNKTDIAVLVIDATEGKKQCDEELIHIFKEKEIPYIIVNNKADLLSDSLVKKSEVCPKRAEADETKENVSDQETLKTEKENASGISDQTEKTVSDSGKAEKNAVIISGQKLYVSALTGYGIYELKECIGKLTPNEDMTLKIVGDLLNPGDFAVLVVPIDSAAPKGRLILPQVQTLRELLDKKCMVMSVTTDKLLPALNMLQQAPKLIITDSQVFDYVYQNKPAESMLTSFSVLFAAYKGDLPYYMEGARQIDAMNENSHVLIAECCTHAPLSEDIGRVKIPRMLRKRFGERLRIDHVSGTDFPQDLEGYDLIIQCGACMFNRRYVVSRIDRAKAQNIPMTNYGITIAHLTGILDKIVLTLR